MPRPSILDPHLPALAKAAQGEYDAWEQDGDGLDPELGAGGICHLIADRMVEALLNVGFEATSTHSEGVGENHVWVTAKTDAGVVVIDIPPGRYEIGSGFVWRKIPGVSFVPSDIFVDIIDPDPESFPAYVADAFAP